MTGYARVRGPIGTAWELEMTARSVNHRFLDLTVRARDAEAALEPVVRQVFGRHLSRGKVDVSLRLIRSGGPGPTVVIDERLLESLLGRLDELARRYPIKAEIQARDLLSIPQLLSIDVPSDGLSSGELAAVEALAESAAASLVGMREEEGTRIADDLRQRVASLESRLAPIQARRDQIVQAVASTLRDRMRHLFADLRLDAGRLEQEAALAAEKSDVAEELSRLAGHLDQFRGLLDRPTGPVGKKLDFLSQEILREINTLGSKARDLELTREVLDMKAETEKIREQVQNLE